MAEQIFRDLLAERLGIARRAAQRGADNILSVEIGYNSDQLDLSFLSDGVGRDGDLAAAAQLAECGALGAHRQVRGRVVERAQCMLH